MFISNHLYHEYDRTITEFRPPSLDRHAIESTPQAENQSISDIQWGDVSINYSEENGFFKGFFVALPISVSLWVIIIWGVKAFFF